VKLVPGTLYFISEIDVLTGEKFDYYKIGLVKDSRQGDSLDRAGEHQTGNPRRLVVRHTVESPAINDLETIMHDLYATERVFGEWFVLSGSAVKRAVAKAEALAQEQRDSSSDAELAAEFTEIPSNEILIPAAATSLALYKDVQVAKFEQKEIKAIFAAEREFFANLSASKFDPTLFFQTTPKTSSKLEEDKLLAAHPDIYNRFVQEVTTISASFTVSPPHGITLKLPKKLEQALTDQKDRLATAGKRPTEDAVREIHMQHLTLLGAFGDAEWREDMAGTQLRALIQGNLGIEGVARWSRVSKTSEKFIAKDFKKEYPELTEEFTVRTTSTSSAIADMRSYR